MGEFRLTGIAKTKPQPIMTGALLASDGEPALADGGGLHVFVDERHILLEIVGALTGLFPGLFPNLNLHSQLGGGVSHRILNIRN